MANFRYVANIRFLTVPELFTAGMIQYLLVLDFFRYMFAVAKLPYEDIRVKSDDWSKLKPSRYTLFFTQDVLKLFQRSPILNHLFLS